MPRPTVAIFDGGSITANTGTGTESWPSTVMDSLSWTGISYYSNEASSSKTWNQLVANAPTAIDAHYSPGNLNIAVGYQGYADLYYGMAPVHVFGRLMRWHNERRTKGFKTVAGTVLPGNVDDLYISQAAFDARRAELNTLIRTWSAAFCDGLVDLAADSRIGDDGDQDDTTYFLDGVHLTNTGIITVASLYHPVLDAFTA